MFLVSVTRLRIRSWRFMPAFAVMALRTGNQVREAEGNLATHILRDGARIVWTMSMWKSEAAMRAYILAGAHRQAMRKLLEWCDEASVVHWEQEGAELPTWSEAHARMQNEGRPSKVHHPSEAQQAYRVRKPKSDRGTTRLK